MGVVGQLGDFCFGKKLSPNSVEADVVIETLKERASEKERCNFLIKADNLGKFSHPHIVRLEGVVSMSVPNIILTEFMSNGSLVNFLKVRSSAL